MKIDAVAGSPLPEMTITGEHLELRPFVDSDVGLIEEASQDAFIPTITTVPSVYSHEEGLAFIKRQATRFTSGTGFALAIVDRDEDRAIGHIGLWIPVIHHGRAEIGYWVAPSGRGRGAAATAVRMLSDWAFASIDVDRLTLYIEPWNGASRATAEKAGYFQEALLHKWQRVDGVAKDMWAYSRLRPDAAAS